MTPDNPDSWSDRQWSIRATELAIGSDANAATAMREVRELSEIVSGLMDQLNSTNAMLEDLAVMVISMSEQRSEKA